MDEYLTQLLFVFVNTSSYAFWNIAVTVLLLKACNLILGFEQVHLFLHITQLSSPEIFANSVEFMPENRIALMLALPVSVGCFGLLSSPLTKY